MFFQSKERVDQDVENLRKLTISPEQRKKEQEAEEKAIRKQKENTADFTWKDILAMSIAVIQVLLPYVLTVVFVMGAVILLFLVAAS